MERFCKLYFLKGLNQVILSWQFYSVLISDLLLSLFPFFFTQGFTAVLTFESGECRAQSERNQVKSITSVTYFLNFIFISLLAYSLSATCKTTPPRPFNLAHCFWFHTFFSGCLCNVSSHPLVSLSTKERRSRIPFLKQWSQVGHSRARLSREEMESWAKSLDALLESRGECKGHLRDTIASHGSC